MAVPATGGKAVVARGTQQRTEEGTLSSELESFSFCSGSPLLHLCHSICLSLCFFHHKTDFIAVCRLLVEAEHSALLTMLELSLCAWDSAKSFS